MTHTWIISTGAHGKVEQKHVFCLESELKHFSVIQLYKSGSFLVYVNDDKLYLDPRNPRGYDMANLCDDQGTNLETELIALEGIGGDEVYVRSNTVSFAESKILTQAWSQDKFGGLEDLGWIHTKTQCLFYGPLRIEEGTRV